MKVEKRSWIIILQNFEQVLPCKIYDITNDKWKTKINSKCGSFEIVYEIGKPGGFDKDVNIIYGQGVYFLNSLQAASNNKKF